MKFEDIKKKLQLFAAVRDWDQFHSPKNLAMALSAETGELIEHFQWVTEEQSKNLAAVTLEQVREEIADVQIYLVRLADKLGIDIPNAVEDKIAKNEIKYPADKVRGSALKYTTYQGLEKKEP